MKTIFLFALGAGFSLTTLMAQSNPFLTGFTEATQMGSLENRTTYTYLGGIYMYEPATTGLVTGRPYSAVAVTHSEQVYGDGLRIEHTNKTALYRDEQGRTRTDSDNGSHVNILDPIQGLNINLEVLPKLATKAIMVNARKNTFNRPSQGLPSPFETAQLQAKRTPGAVAEDLGKQTINGVPALGARVVNTIPFGKLGNDREFKIVYERWVSQDLQVLVKTVTTDPREGTITYELTNISRFPPDPRLFEIPAEYTVTVVDRNQNGGRGGQ